MLSTFSDEEAEMRRTLATSVFSLLLSLRLCDGFKIVSTSKAEKVHQVGDEVKLTCRTDSYWEYCTWTHKQRQCHLEWKYAKVDDNILTKRTFI